MTNHDNAPALVTQAFAFALDPTTEQISMLRAVTSAARASHTTPCSDW
ncbi:MAG TPA: hypothetical protein VMV96_05400 [Acidimicrobiales bacterium]|nr:hypothetical protein [Acidimicrobiales bacterium]